jgi:hypothetical protein
MMARRSEGLISNQPAISSRERPQPMQMPEAASISQISMQGVSMRGLGSVSTKSYVGAGAGRGNCVAKRNPQRSPPARRGISALSSGASKTRWRGKVTVTAVPWRSLLLISKVPS